MSPYMSGTNDDSPLYGLYAVVVHVDLLNASFFGHYICYVKDSNGVWYKIDDSKVQHHYLREVLNNIPFFWDGLDPEVLQGSFQSGLK